MPIGQFVGVSGPLRLLVADSPQVQAQAYLDFTIQDDA
jgi:hypothetical protein